MASSLAWQRFQTHGNEIDTRTIKGEQDAGANRWGCSFCHALRSLRLLVRLEMNTFEEQLTEGVATYIHSYCYDPEARALDMIVFHSPDSPQNFRTIHSDQIEEYNEILTDDADPDFIEGIIGASQGILDYGMVKTMFHTDLREISFVSSGVTTIRKTEQDSSSNL